MGDHSTRRRFAYRMCEIGLGMSEFTRPRMPWRGFLSGVSCRLLSDCGDSAEVGTSWPLPGGISRCCIQVAALKGRLLVSPPLNTLFQKQRTTQFIKVGHLTEGACNLRKVADFLAV